MNSKHKCDCCNNPEEALKQQKELMDKFGYIVHLVADEENPYGLINAHTHGLETYLCGYNFQIVLNLRPEIITGIFYTISELVKKGVVFEDGSNSMKVLKGFEVKFKEFKSDNEKVLRVLIPDPNGLLPTDEGCHKTYAQQLLTI